MIVSQVKSHIRDIKDFPKPGIVFKDISPILKNPSLCKAIIKYKAELIAPLQPDVLLCLDSRGFWFGLGIALELGIPMIPVRKEGKLPYSVVAQEYDLEYGTAKIEIQTDAIESGTRVVIHDDLLATGGTATACAQLAEKLGGKVVGFSFLVELSFLEGRKKLEKYSNEILSPVKY